MAQADEMGEAEGRDDGFVEGLDPVSRRRNKKRAGRWRGRWLPWEYNCLETRAIESNFVDALSICHVCVCLKGWRLISCSAQSK